MLPKLQYAIQLKIYWCSKRRFLYLFDSAKYRFTLTITSILGKIEQPRSLLNNEHLKYIIIISKNAPIPHKFLCDFIEQKPRYYYPKNFFKIVIATLAIKLCPQKLNQCYLLNYVCCMQNFVRLHAAESEMERLQEFWEKWNSSSSY